MKKLAALAGMILIFCPTLFSQVCISPDNSMPDPSAGLEVKFTDKGLLLPRMTQAQRDVIPAPAEGLVVVCINCGPGASSALSVYLNGSWQLLTTASCPMPETPGAGNHVPFQTQVIWNWTAVAGAIGYKWNTCDNLATSIDLGSALTRTESGLICNTAYARFVWAYNACGHSSPATLNQSTLSCLVCGDQMVVNHIAGAVAPVTKTVTYGTVTNVPGELTKCWITRNLGAGQQANSVDDPAEPPAGWYWQFNRKQGYKHDGSTLTPSWTITGINENLSWTLAEDPCALELGPGWRVPAQTEWNNLKTTGNWDDWTDAWNSLLKLHASGYLSNSNGSVNSRGATGYFWSSSPVNFTVANYLYFYNTYCGIGENSKAFGLSVRCVLP